MKNMKKVLALILSFVMMMAMGVSVFADGTGSITIAPPEGTDSGATNTYYIYKVFDADGNGSSISYKLVSGKTTAPAGFKVDSAGNVTYVGTGTDGLTADDINAIADYVTPDDLVTTATSTGTADAVASGLPNGFYYITTSTGSVVTIDSTNPNATVNDKNTVPTVDKTITGASSYDENGKKALAQVGTDVTFTATITVGKGAKNYVFHDKMGTGLSYNNDASVAGVDNSQYAIKDTPDGDDTLTITFADGIAEGTVITITYTGKITSDALTTDPAKNTAYISYGDENSNNRTPDSETETYNAKFTVTKKDGSGNALAGAGFVITNAQGKYYKLAEGSVSWVDTIDDATEYTSDSSGAVPAFTGLADGTYTLIEKTVPAGYNKAADSTFTVAARNYDASNLEQAATVTNNAGSELPSTGGTGTAVFYIIGAILVLGAGVILIARRRMNAR